MSRRRANEGIGQGQPHVAGLGAKSAASIKQLPVNVRTHPDWHSPLSCPVHSARLIYCAITSKARALSFAFDRT